MIPIFSKGDIVVGLSRGYSITGIGSICIVMSVDSGYNSMSVQAIIPRRLDEYKEAHYHIFPVARDSFRLATKEEVAGLELLLAMEML